MKLYDLAATLSVVAGSQREAQAIFDKIDLTTTRVLVGNEPVLIAISTGEYAPTEVVALDDDWSVEVQARRVGQAPPRMEGVEVLHRRVTAAEAR